MDITDNRTANTLVKEWRKLQEIKRSLVRSGILNGDATATEIIEAIRYDVPHSIFHVPDEKAE